MSVLMVSLRSFLLSTTKGHMVRFESNVPTEVPESILQEAMAAGCVPANKEDAPFVYDLTRSVVEFQGDARRSTIFLAVKSLAEENDSANFDGGSYPKQEVVADRLGYPVSSAEVRDIYQQYLSAKSSGEAFVLHPQAQNILRVIEATSKGELIELSEEFGVDVKRAKGMTVRDLRRLLLTKFSGNAAG